jgi:hypothetical protein
MAPSFRDRFFTPPVAGAITSPLGILLAGAGAAIGIITGLGIPGAIVLGGLAWGGRVAAAIPRKERTERVDPFALGEPWRRFVQEALQAKSRFEQAVGDARSGPLRDRLREIGEQMQTAVDECWQVAQRGQQLADARRHLDVSAAQRELAEIEAQTGAVDPASTTAGTVSALRAQLASAERMDRTIVGTRDRLRLLDARLDEAAARAIELSAQAGSVADLSGLGADVDDLVSEMEALRQGLEEAGGATAAGGVAG